MCLAISTLVIIIMITEIVVVFPQEILHLLLINHLPLPILPQIRSLIFRWVLHRMESQYEMVTPQIILRVRRQLSRLTSTGFLVRVLRDRTVDALIRAQFVVGLFRVLTVLVEICLLLQLLLPLQFLLCVILLIIRDCLAPYEY